MFAVTEAPCSPKAYNNLPGIMDADAAIKPLDFALSQLVSQGSILCEDTPFAHGQVGAFLLHKHWQVEDDECMIERPGLHPNGRPALTTSAQSSRAMSGLAPSRFMIDPRSKQFIALEFSSDSYVKEMWHDLLAHPSFIQRTCDLVSETELQDQIGFGIFARAGIPVCEGEELVEESWNQASVLSAQTLTSDHDSVLVRTGWSFVSARKRDIQAAQCIAYCMGAGSSAHCKHHYNRPVEAPPKTLPQLIMTPAPLCALHD